MAASKHLHIEIVTAGRERVKAQAPVIISASRATDVPAFYSDWFFNRLEKGYARWRNPFNGADSYVSFANTRFIVFWSKNPKPLLPFLDKLKERGIGCYIQFTLNDYEAEGIEPNVPALDKRIETFKQLVEQLGKGGVIWRFDPLLLTDEISTDKLLERIYYIGEQLHRYTEKLVFSFADIATYPRVKRNLQQCHVNYLEWDATAMNDFAQKLSALNRDKWNLTLATCAEEIALEQYGIEHNRCIDPELIARLSPDDAALQQFLYSARKDTGQRKMCGCILAKDIGSYNTCAHGCKYCYANTSPLSASYNLERHNPHSETIIY